MTLTWRHPLFLVTAWLLVNTTIIGVYRVFGDTPELRAYAMAVGIVGWLILREVKTTDVYAADSLRTLRHVSLLFAIICLMTLILA